MLRKIEGMVKMKCDELKEVYAYQSDEIESLVGSANGNSYYLKSEVDAAITELKTENRRMKRALWMAREARAKAMWQKILRDAGIFFAIGKSKEWDFYNTKQKKWQRVETKCRAKAEEYK